MLKQQRANVSALGAVAARAEAEIVCMQRSLRTAEDVIAEMRERPRVALHAESRDPNESKPMLAGDESEANAAARLAQSPLVACCEGCTSACTPSCPSSCRPSEGSEMRQLEESLPVSMRLMATVGASEAALRQCLTGVESRCDDMEARLSRLVRKSAG